MYHVMWGAVAVIALGFYDGVNSMQVMVGNFAVTGAKLGQNGACLPGKSTLDIVEGGSFSTLFTVY